MLRFRWPLVALYLVLSIGLVYVLAPRIGTEIELTFVIRDRAGRAEWVDVRQGAIESGLVEITGDLHADDRVIRRATDETRDGSSIREK